MIRLRNLLDIGVTDSLDIVESNKQRVFNLFILLAIPSIPFVLLLNFFRGNYEMVILNSLQLLICVFACWISISRKLLFLRTFLLILLSSIIFIAAIFFKPGIEYRLLFIIVVGVILFDNNYKYLLFSLLIACEFTLCRYLELKHTGTMGPILVTRSLQVFVPFIITCFSLFYLKYIYLKSQNKLQKALTQVSISNEMHEKLMFSLAHDLRSPLTNITVLVKLLKQNDKYTEEEVKWMEMIELSASNSNALVNELLESNELMKNKLEPKLQDLNLLVENVVISARLKAEKKDITIALQKLSPNCFANVDALKIDRLISNLVNNSIKFSHLSGHIQIEITKDEGQAIISIKDNGIGIDKKYIPTVFEPFTKAKRRGTINEASFGLGLSICKQITDLHEGNIKVISELGKGTEFLVSLPI